MFSFWSKEKASDIRFFSFVLPPTHLSVGFVILLIVFTHITRQIRLKYLKWENMLNDHQAEMVAIFENNNYKVRPIKSEFDTSLMINHITRRIPKQNIYIAIKESTPEYCIRYMGQESTSGTAWMKIDLYAKELSHWVHNMNSVDNAILYLGGEFWQDIDTKNYWNKLVENLSLPSANLSIVDSDGLVNLLESK